MTDTVNLVEKFGSEVIKENLDTKENYVFDKTGKILDESKHKISHLHNGVFPDSKSLVSFLSEYGGIEINLMSENLPSQINQSAKLISDYKNILNPSLSIENHDTWDVNFDRVLNQCCSLFSVMVEDVEENLNEVRADISNADIQELIEKDLDDNSILLMNGMITGNYETRYNDGMRFIVYNHVKNNREKTPAGRIILSSLKEGNNSFSDIINKINEVLNIK